MIDEVLIDEVRIKKQTLDDIADALREKHGTQGDYAPSEMRGAILDIEGGGAEDLDTELTEQEGLIEQLMTILEGKASGGGGEPMEMVATFADGTTKTYVIYGGIAE